MSQGLNLFERHCLSGHLLNSLFELYTIIGFKKYIPYARYFRDNVQGKRESEVYKMVIIIQKILENDKW